MPSVLVGRVPGHFLEQAAHVVRVLETDFVSYFAHRLAGAGEEVLDAVDDGEVYVFHGRLAGFLLD